MSAISKQYRLNYMIFLAALLVLVGLGLWLRLRFVHTVNLYPDEFVTLLAVRMIQEKGLPLMPSGLFYEHGLLFSYLGSLAALLGPARLVVRYASLACGLLAAGLTFYVGRRWFSPAAGLLAAAGLVISPAAIEWSGRARMYALLQLLVLLVIWLAGEGVVRQQARRRWLALLAYLGAVLAHFVAVTLAPPLVAASVAVGWLNSVSFRYANADREPPPQNPENLERARPFLAGLKRAWPDLAALALVLGIAFLVKRAGQPMGIEALEPAGALPGLAQVLAIYSSFNFSPARAWQDLAPFYLSLPALIFTPFALVAMVVAGWQVGRLAGWPEKARNPQLHLHFAQAQASNFPTFQLSFTLFLSLILLLTTVEMLFFASPDRRDDKYLFMLLPVLLLLGARGMEIVGARGWRLGVRGQGLGARDYTSEITPPSPPPGGAPRKIPPSGGLGGPGARGQGLGVRSKSPGLQPSNLPSPTPYSPAPSPQPLTPLLLAGLIIAASWPGVGALLANTGDDYDAAFGYVQAHWQPGDTVLTGTPPAAAFYLDRSDFYAVQRQGGYNYRLLTVDGRLVDRWLGSPAIRTEADLHRVLAGHNVWLVLERWGLQREYYDLPFQQQLLAQTEPVAEAQAKGFFVLRSRPDPRPLALLPARAVEANLAGLVRLLGYTLEPQEAAAGSAPRLTLYWQPEAPLPADYTVFVHLRRPGGGTVAQADHRPLGHLYPTTLWPVGEIIRESSELPLPPDLAPGEYELWTGMYLLETGERLAVQNDASGENAVRLGRVTVR